VTAVQGELLASGPNSSPYAVAARTSQEPTWYSDLPKRQLAMDPRSPYTSTPATPGAARAWRAAGSAALPSGDNLLLPPGQLWWGAQAYTLAEFQRLPATVNGLTAAIWASLQETYPKAAVTYDPTWPWEFPSLTLTNGKITRGTVGYDRIVFAMSLDLLDHEPVTPQVKATALRVMATLPEIRLAGQATDPLGRTGAAITMDQAFMISTAYDIGSESPQLQAVIAPSGNLLAEEWVATRLPAGVATSPSGAVPGPTKCPPGYYKTPATRSTCYPTGFKITPDSSGYTITPPDPSYNTGDKALRAYPQVTLNQPVLAVTPGTVTAYHAVVGAEWTNRPPPASAQVLPPGIYAFSG
jgi:hypothetical protein